MDATKNAALAREVLAGVLAEECGHCRVNALLDMARVWDWAVLLDATSLELYIKGEQARVCTGAELAQALASPTKLAAEGWPYHSLQELVLANLVLAALGVAAEQ